jgi:hypothetical protein
VTYRNNDNELRKLNFVAWVRDRTVQTKWLPLVGEVSANFRGYKGCLVVSVTDPYGRNLGFFYRRPEPLIFFHVAPQLYSRDCMDPVPDLLLLRKSGSAGNRTRPFGSAPRNSDH